MRVEDAEKHFLMTPLQTTEKGMTATDDMWPVCGLRRCPPLR